MYFRPRLVEYVTLPAFRPTNGSGENDGANAALCSTPRASISFSSRSLSYSARASPGSRHAAAASDRQASLFIIVVVLFTGRGNSPPVLQCDTDGESVNRSL